MAGIYIHIPFCRQACIYCNFYFSTSLKTKTGLLSAIKDEIRDKTDYLDDEYVETIYFGGGTPSLLNALEIRDILEAVYQTFKITPNPEITLEANPDDLDEAKIKELKSAGINRLSIGIQSFNDKDLAFLNRAHNAGQAIECIESAKRNGIDLLSIDLIYGIPGQDDETWQANLDMVAKYHIPHFSAYALTVEPKTQLAYLIGKHQLAPVDEEQSIRNFKALTDWATLNNYLQYEISNFCSGNNFSKHNTAYWQGKKYAGFGPSAHSYNGESRQWNIGNNALYIKQIGADEVYFEREMLTKAQKYNEYIMTSLRTCWGAESEYIKSNFGVEYSGIFLEGARQFLEEGYVFEKDGNYILTASGKLLADGIISELFIVE